MMKMVSIAVLALGIGMVLSCPSPAGDGNGGGTGVTGVTGGTGGTGVTGNNRIGAKFVTHTSSKKNVSRSITNQTEEISGMFFGDLEIMAYQYSPGFVNTDIFLYPNNGPYDGYDHNGGYIHPKDWAPYRILAYGNKSIFILPNGGEVDLSEFEHPYQIIYTPQFTDTWDNFNIDFFQVSVQYIGVVFNDILYGQDVWAPDSINGSYNLLEWLRLEHPTLKKSIKTPVYIEGFEYHPGGPNMAVNIPFTILFARSNWFPEPVFVRLFSWENNAVQWSSKTITEHQKNMLVSWANNAAFGILGSNINLLIVPYGELVKFAVKEGSTGMKSPEFRISFNYEKLLTTASYNNISDGVIFSATNDLPFGLSVSINETQ